MATNRSTREHHQDVTQSNERRIASFLLNKNTVHYDDEMYLVCEEYIRKHKELRKALVALDKDREAELVWQRADASIAEKVRFIFENPFASPAAKAVFLMTSMFIVLSVIVLVLRTVPKFSPVVKPEFKDTWLWIEGGVTIYFTIELSVRFAVSKDKITFLKQITTIFEIIALVPFYVDLITANDIGALQVLRLFRVLQFFRTFQTVNDLFTAVSNALKVLLAPLVFLVAVILVASTIVYYAERGEYDPALTAFMVTDCGCESSAAFILGHKECPKIQSQFDSILHTMWWGVVTLTTVGYGDLVPQCSFGKLVASTSMVLGIVFMAMPIAIVGSYFTLQVDARKAKELATRLEEAKRRKRAQEGRRGVNDPSIALGDVMDETEMVPQQAKEKTTPAVRFFRFLRERLESPTLSIDNPGPYALMLIDFFLGTQASDVMSAPSAVTFELEYLNPTQAAPASPTGSPTGRGDGGSMQLATRYAPGKRILLNRYVDLVVGSSSHDFPDPDIVIPLDDLEKSTGLRYRVSQRHAAISVPPQYTDQPMIIRPLRGAAIYVNGNPVPEQGVALRTGDTVNLGDPQHPLVYRIKAVHPFALDI